MKISQRNWEFWFLSNVVLLAAVMVSGMCIQGVKTPEDILLKNVAVYGSSVLFFSLIPCLYIGSKPLKD